MTLFQLRSEHWVHILVPVGFPGLHRETLSRKKKNQKKKKKKLTAFRNKSMLFQRELRPNEVTCK
uniref:NADH dehydrogenase [ubiquinone] 1 beta subcomplex subunit 1 n=1 Tax=Mus spicilegus TaxID=10103 RepID=A0A8C6MP86_MUSSI